MKTDLPQKLKPIKVTYTYENGEEYYIEGVDVANYNSNISAGAVMDIRQPGFYKSVEWTKLGPAKTNTTEQGE